MDVKSDTELEAFDGAAFSDHVAAEDAGKRLEELLLECVRLDASDLHLAPGLAPYFRIHGDLGPRQSFSVMTVREVLDAAAFLMQSSGNSGFKETGAQDGAFTGAEGARFRFNVYRRLGGVAVAIRRLEDRFRTLGELGLPESLYGFCGLPDGIVLVAGPTGAGKSTTLAALIDRINQTRRTHIVTIEDPIEYIHAPIQSLVNQRQIGSDASSFNDALVASLREDPDVILLGEVRDLDTIRTAIRAAETGHLVFTTVHAGDCVSTLERMVAVFPADEQAGIRQQISLVLRAIVTQHLLPADGSGPDGAGRPGFEGAGPGRGSRSRGRVVASEILINTPAVAHLIAAGKSAQIYSSMESGARLGMQTLEHDLARLYVSGRISETSALAGSRYPAIVKDMAALLLRKGDPVASIRRAAP